MVQAQQYIEDNFPKHVNELVARSKDLEGSLDLTEYQNLTFITVYGNPRLTSLRLGYSPQLNRTISITNTGITDFSFFLNTPSVTEPLLVNRDESLRSSPQEVAQVIRSLAQEHHSQLNEKDREIKRLKRENERLQQQNAQLQSSNQQNNQNQAITNLNSQLASLSIQIANHSQQITSLNNQVREKEKQLTELKTEDDKLKSEIKSLSSQIAQLQKEKTFDK